MAGTEIKLLMKILETDRLALRKLTPNDAEFILQLLNEPSFLRYIGDKNVRTLDDARQYILSGPVDSYQRNGFGLYLVELKDAGLPIGMCGLIKRQDFTHADIGYAFLPDYWGKGYAVESAAAVLLYAKNAMGLQRILAITSPDNESSIRVLEKIGLKFERVIKLAPDNSEVKLFAMEF